MRLIDADKLIESVKNHNYCHRCPYSDECYIGDGEQVTCEKFMIVNIEEQPTAYDIDEVIEELNYIEMKWDKACPMPNEHGEPMCDLDCVECQIRRCRRTVERGGIYE